MPTTVYTVEEIELQDGSIVTLKPLSIKGLRKFMERMDEFPESTTNDEGMDVLLDCAAICLMKQREEFWDAEKKRGNRKVTEGKREVTKPKPFGGHTEEAEDALDMPTVYRILDVCGGVKLDDPKLLEAAQEAVLGAASTSQG